MVEALLYTLLDCPITFLCINISQFITFLFLLIFIIIMLFLFSLILLSLSLKNLFSNFVSHFLFLLFPYSVVTDLIAVGLKVGLFYYPFISFLKSLFWHFFSPVVIIISSVHKIMFYCVIIIFHFYLAPK